MEPLPNFQQLLTAPTLPDKLTNTRKHTLERVQVAAITAHRFESHAVANGEAAKLIKGHAVGDDVVERLAAVEHFVRKPTPDP